MRQKGFVGITVITVIAVLLAVFGYTYYQAKNTNIKNEVVDTTPTSTATSVPTDKPKQTSIPTNKPIAKTPSPTTSASDCSRFDKTKKAKVTINVKTETQPVTGSLGWFLFLKPGGDCPGQTPGGATLTFGAENNGPTSYTSPDLVPGQYRLDVTSANRKSIGITIDVPEGESTQTVEVK